MVWNRSLTLSLRLVRMRSWFSKESCEVQRPEEASFSFKYIIGWSITNGSMNDEVD